MLLTLLAAIAAVYATVSVILALILGRFFRRNRQRAAEALENRQHGDEDRRKAS